MVEKNVAIGEKYLITINEASVYFNIGVKKLRRMAENNAGGFALDMGNRFLIIRPKFENYVNALAEQGVGCDEES